MRKLLKSRKGMTMIETIVALAILGIVSLPLLMTFTNAQIVILKTETRIEVNAVMRTIKENVIASVKYGSGNVIESYVSSPVDLSTAKNGTSLKVIGKDGKLNSKYMFDATRTKDFDDKVNAKDTCEYKITLKKMDGTAVQELYFLINRIESK